VTLRTDFNADFGGGGADGKGVAARAGNLGFFVIGGMYFRFHYTNSTYKRPFWQYIDKLPYLMVYYISEFFESVAPYKLCLSHGRGRARRVVP